MLIRTQEQQTKAKIVRHVSCTWCRQPLDYPRIVADDASSTSYHVSCALQLQADITADLLELLDDPELVAKFARHLEVESLFKRVLDAKLGRES